MNGSNKATVAVATVAISEAYEAILRDWLAAEAMKVLVPKTSLSNDTAHAYKEQVASTAYKYADAMMNARERA